MLKHLCKLIWNKKKQNFLLITEIFISFLVLFAVFSLLVFFYRNYKQPMGMDYENVWAVEFKRPDKINSNDSISLYYETIRNLLRTMPQIKNASFTSPNYPFASSTMNNSMGYQNRRTSTNFFLVEDDYLKVLNLKVIEGKWFDKSDNATKERSIVINQTFKEKLFGNENALGKIIGDAPDAMKIVGVVNDFKDKGDYQGHSAGYFERIDTSNHRTPSAILLSVQPSADAAFEGRLFKSLSNLMGSSIEIIHLTDKRNSINRVTLIPMIVLLIVAGFLITNVALGLFGVLWYNINLRKGEIGLRRAVGASGKSVSAQLIGEALVLATFSLIVGSFFAVQFPLLNVFDLSANIYIIAMLLAILFIYLLVIICSLYPGKQAAAIYPAVALHEE